MDLRLMAAAPTDAERAVVDGRLGPPQTGWRGGEWDPAVDGHVGRGGARRAIANRNLLLPALHAVQSEIGWISPGALNYVCERLTVPPAEAYGVATFYALLTTEPRAPRVAHVCDDIACGQAGADEIGAALEAALGASGTGEDMTWLRSPCLGQCERAPAVYLQLAGDDDIVVAPATPAATLAALAPGAATEPADGSSVFPVDAPVRSLLARVGRADPGSLAAYRAHGGYEALRAAVAMGPLGVIREVTESGLKGRGGAAFPTGVKWEGVARAPARPHYLVCNADESEPGTFKDRVLMEDDPFAVVESMTIAAYATGAEAGYLYVRGEYPLATRRLQAAIDQATARSLLGPDVMGAGFRFDIEIRSGAGAYICGEETALFNSIEGFRGEPRQKPPFPTEAGLFGKPTTVNNVETLVNVLGIVLEGGAAYAATGTSGSTGTKLFCVSGAVAAPGLYEVEFGTTLGDLLERAGGAPGGIQAVLLGGAAGSFVGPDRLDVPLTFEGLRDIGAALGSGVVMVFAPGTDMGRIVRRIAAFFRDESCGQCVPCRVGTVRQEEALARYLSADGDGAAARALIDEIAAVMRDASICGLGQTAAGAVQSALRLGLLDGAAP